MRTLGKHVSSATTDHKSTIDEVPMEGVRDIGEHEGSIVGQRFGGMTDRVRLRCQDISGDGDSGDRGDVVLDLN